jgi:hypothetical protein
MFRQQSSIMIVLLLVVVLNAFFHIILNHVPRRLQSLRLLLRAFRKRMPSSMTASSIHVKRHTTVEERSFLIVHLRRIFFAKTSRTVPTPV